MVQMKTASIKSLENARVVLFLLWCLPPLPFTSFQALTIHHADDRVIRRRFRKPNRVETDYVCFLLLCLVVAPIRSLLLPIDSPVSLTPFSSALFDLASESSSPSISRELPGVDFSFVSGDQEHAMTRRPRSSILILGWQSAETCTVSGQASHCCSVFLAFFFSLTRCCLRSWQAWSS